jgi:hypothetical protein
MPADPSPNPEDIRKRLEQIRADYDAAYEGTERGYLAWQAASDAWCVAGPQLLAAVEAVLAVARDHERHGDIAIARGIRAAIADALGLEAADG